MNNTTTRSFYHISKERPHHLTAAEKADPTLVFYNLFDSTSLDSLQKRLWKMFTCAITETQSELSAREREEIVFAYEAANKVIESAFVLNERDKLRVLYNHDFTLNADNEWEEEEDWGDPKKEAKV